MGKASRDKGKRGERELANVLKEYGFDTHRGVQYQGGHDSPDVVGLPGIHIECKRVEKLNLDAAMKQANEDCGKQEAPAVFHRKNGGQWHVTMELRDWMFIFLCAQGGCSEGADFDRKENIFAFGRKEIPNV